MQGLFTDEPNVIICINCDGEFVIQDLSADISDVCFCPFCGGDLYEEDELNYEDDDDAV
jgi:hypothetical protein